MLNMTYIGETDIYNVNFTKKGAEVTITGEFPVKYNGFYLSRIGKNDNWDYSAFTSVKRRIKNGAIFVEG